MDLIQEAADGLPIAGWSVALPNFVPSVSSIRTKASMLECLTLLVGRGGPFLLSAFDVAQCTDGVRRQVVQLLQRQRTNGGGVFLDSGTYEGQWRTDAEWDASAFDEVVSEVPHDYRFVYDSHHPPETAQAIAEAVEESVVRAQECGNGTVIPIVHGRPSVIREAVHLTAQAIEPMMLAVPERRLGRGLIDRAGMIRRIRLSLNELPAYVPLHILGTGHPVSLITYSLAGADSFDGLEWCRQVIDHETGRVLPFEHWDLLQDGSSVDSGPEWPWAIHPLFYNLRFYDQFMRRLRVARSAGTLDALLGEHVGGAVLTRLLEACQKGDTAP